MDPTKTGCEVEPQFLRLYVSVLVAQVKTRVEESYNRQVGYGASTTRRSTVHRKPDIIFSCNHMESGKFIPFNTEVGQYLLGRGLAPFMSYAFEWTEFLQKVINDIQKP